MYKIEFKKLALKQVQKISENKKVMERLQLILGDIISDPYSTNFKFERLKHNLKGYCSKRLNKKDRVIYEVKDDIITVLILSVLGHYGE